MGLIEKTIETDINDGCDFYAYSITELGVDEVIKNEDIIFAKATEKLSGLNELDDDIPF
ncbi:hypothetical protein [Chromobacterium amazonense]|uniref:hypothetical protein n=1 Tax=Chromobacterium amazonense TaxID=1382803 RepID=UPI0014708922|nr:hypothetical protein [Chromobacterium amazonense]